MNKTYNPTFIKLEPDWDCGTLKILPMRIGCKWCGRPMKLGGMASDLGYGEKDRIEDTQYDWLLLSCADCNLEIAIPLRVIEQQT